MLAVVVDWPEEPYKGLVWYGPEDRLLFSGRDAAVTTCMHYIAASETRILLLHGQTGCGKSSFLRAALIPDLEEKAHGYLFMRDAGGLPLFIRSGPDPLARIAEQVFRFASDAVSVPGIAGETYDLSAARLGRTDVAEFVQECRKPGMLSRSLRSLCEIPKTLVIILDQAEEVLTFGADNPEHRRQFFRFVREFSTSNFPVKLIIALRKDYSGEFLGFAQLGGAIDLRTNPVDMSPPSPDGSIVDRVVKSDIKIYLLPELRRAEVQHAIELPTSKETVYEGKAPPFDKYQFTYAAGVAKRIVDDLFAATSATAVLPVMQIVCRDLYHAAKRARAGTPPWQIDDKLYRDGGGVSGPVSRHITESLRKSFGKLPAGTDLAAEEQRWRELLYRLVRRESDGAVHTNIVDEAQFRAMADDIGVKAALEDVTAYLTRSDVLLLRTVTALVGAEGHESKLFSLGHDAIGMVLYEWKMRALATERVAAEQEAAKKRRRKVAWAGIGVAFTAFAVGFVVFMAIVAGRADNQHKVLMSIAMATERREPINAAFAAAHAHHSAVMQRQAWKRVPDEVLQSLKSSSFWGSGDKEAKAKALLAGIVAGLPKKTEFKTDQARETNDGGTGLPLPKVIGFAHIDGTSVEVVTGVHGKDAARMKYYVDTPGNSATTVWTGGEPEAGTVVLLQSVLPSDSLESAKTVDRVYVITRDRQGQYVQPLDASYFRRKAMSSAWRPPATQEKKGARSAVPLGEFVWLDLGGSIVVLNMTRPGKDLSKGEMYVASFVFDPKAPAHDPFRLAMEAEFHLDLNARDAIGFNEPLVLDSYMIVPVSIDSTQRGASPDMWAVRYDLRNGRNKALKGPDALMSCKTDKCGWELVRRERSDNLVVFAKATADGTRLAAARSARQAAGLDIKQYEQFLVVDVETDERVSIDAKDLHRARKECVRQFGEKPSPNSDPVSTSRMFVAGATDRLLFGLQTDRALDLLEFRRSGGTATKCLGMLLDAGESSSWRTARNGSTVLASSGNVGLSWNIEMDGEAKAAALVSQGNLVGAACERGLRGHENDALTATTAMSLGPEAPKLCDGAVAQDAERIGRAPVAFPGVEVTTKTALPDAFEKLEKK